jgi:hypothetical protein
MEIINTFKQSIAKIFDGSFLVIFYDVIIARLDVMTLSCCFFVSLRSLCFATDEDGCAVKIFCNTLFKCKT